MSTGFPSEFPFEESDFAPGTTFMDLEGAPFADVPTPEGLKLVNFFGGKAEILPPSELKPGNHPVVSFATFWDLVESSIREAAEAEARLDAMAAACAESAAKAAP